MHYSSSYQHQLEKIIEEKKVGHEVSTIEFFERSVFPHREELFSEVSCKAKNDIVLKCVKICSPGFWGFLGSLNPFEAIRQYLNDRHERNKDIQYKMRLEEEKLSLDNQMVKLEVVKNGIELLKGAGVPDHEIQNLLKEHIVVPFLKLDSHQDRGLISRAEIKRN